MKKIILVALILSQFSTCKKASLVGDHFIFGYYYGECEGNCVNYFMIKKNQLYADAMTNLSDKLKFKNEKLTQDKFNLAKQLRDKFPDYLKNSVSSIYGCPDCRDQGGYYIELKENSKVKKFHIDMDTSQIPNEIKNYVLELKSTLSQL